MRKSFRMTDDMRSRDALVAARAYLNAGLKLILIHGIDRNGQCTCGRKDCPNAGKHPIAEFFPNGAKSSTSNTILIRKALRKYPRANLAATLENRTVVDIDGPRGRAAIDALKLPKTLKVRTKRGYHLHYLGAPDHGSFKCEQVDVITGSNRYAMLPPSLHASGRRYRWHRVSGSKVSRVPKELTELRRDRSRMKPARKQDRRSPAIKKGERNTTLTSVAGYWKPQSRKTTQTDCGG